MSNINLTARLQAQAEISHKLISGGRGIGFSKKGMDVGTLLELSIKNQIKDPSFKKLNIKNKLNKIVELINNKDNIEYSHVVYKSTNGKDFDGFMKRDDAKWLKPLTFVIRIKDDKNEFFTKNTIIFETKLNKLKDGKFTFILENMLLMNFPESEHPLVRGMKRLPSDAQFTINGETELSDSDLIWMKGLRKPIDLWEDDSKLLVNQWRAIMSRFNDYNDSRKQIDIPVFSFEDSVEIKSKKNIKLVAFAPIDFEVSTKTKYFLNNVNESSLKGGFSIRKESKDLAPSIIAKLSSNIDFHEKEFNILLNDIEIINNEMESFKSLIDAEEKKIEVFNESIEENNGYISSVEADLEEISIEHKKTINNLKDKVKFCSKEILKKSNEIKALERKAKKPKKDKKINNTQEISELQTSINNLEIKVKEFKDESMLADKRYDNAKKPLLEELESKKKILSTLNSKKSNCGYESKKLSKSLSKLHARRNSVNVQKNKHSIEIKRLNDNKDTIKNMSEVSKIILLEGTAFVDDRSKKVISIDKYDVEKFVNDPSKYFGHSSWQVSDYDFGFAMVVKRNNQAMKNLSYGGYKSPYLAIDLNNPTSKIQITNKDKRGSLNEKQIKAFQMINNSYQASFLQGPPGTGKTQVISNIVSYYSNNDEISLISSSTNEAINNAMERIDNDNKNNPNVIFLRVTSSAAQKQKATQFLEDKIGTNFINKMIRSSTDVNDSESIAKEILETFSKEEINGYVPEQYFHEFENKKVVDENMEFFSKLFNVPMDDPEYFFEDISSMFRKMKRATTVSIYNEEPISKMIEEFYKSKIDDMNDCTISTYDFISRYVSSTGDSKFASLVSKVKSSINSDNGISKGLNDSIIKTVSTDNLINIIGITTTSRQEIVINGEKREIFTDYPIDFAVIDEVSKCITPEIIQISSLSSKFLYAGDYRQLPPTMDISKEYISEFWKWERSQNKDIQFDKILVKKGINNEDDFSDMLATMYDSTLFKNQVKSLKQSVSGSNSYVALDVQHRFTEEIQSLVNVVYDEAERLQAYDGHKKGHFKNYAIYGSNTRSSTVLIDTSFISKEFVEFATNNDAKYIPQINDVAFDQNRSIFGKGKSFNSMINEYNSFEGISTLMKMKENNPTLKATDIGYICMTRSQVNSINDILKNRNLITDNWDMEWLSKVKIDTVDNFQGREKDVILVDLVRAQNHIGRDSFKLNERTTRNLEFYSRNERLNVAVSRAKSKLILLGAIEGHLGGGVVSDVERNGIKSKIRIFDKYKELIQEKGMVIQSWVK